MPDLPTAAVRTRFAPSPTGYLHIGGVRTALYSWLFARHHGGKYLLRVEDTDRQRSTQEAVDAILDGLSWLGLDADEEPVYQTRRFARHREVAEQLLRSETTTLWRRIALINWGIRLCVTGALTVCLVIVSLFVGAFVTVNIATLIAVLFVLAMFLMIAGLLFLLREVNVSTRTMRAGLEIALEGGAVPPPGQR